MGAPFAGALVTLAGPVTLGWAGVVAAGVVAAAPDAGVRAEVDDPASPAVGSTARGWADGTVTAAVVELVAECCDAAVWLRCAGRCVDAGSLVDPHPTTINAAIAVSTAARMR